MRVVFATLVLVVVALGAPGQALAEDAPRRFFNAAVERTRTSVAQANSKVLEALDAQDWNAWNRAHDAYVNVLVRAVPEIERAVTAFMLSTLRGGGQLMGETAEAIDVAAEDAALYAKQRVISGAYASLTRRGVRPDSRGAALKLLQKQGVYSLDGSVPGERTVAPPLNLGESPLSGKVPTTPEAGEFLSKWQYAYMSAQALGPRIQAYETQIAGLPVDAPNRGDIQTRMEEARAQHKQLLQAIQDYRRQYYAAGGK